jgi:hypothetical protein
MLARPEIGTKQHIILWLASKPADETYQWNDSKRCACGQYWGENVDNVFPHGWWCSNPRMAWLDILAMYCESRTFGELYQRAIALHE